MFELSRRSLLSTGVAAAAWSLLPAAMAAASTPRRGGHLRIGLQGGSSQDTVDPASVLYDASYLLQATCRSTLVHIEADGSLTPNLAEKWEPSDDLTAWTFHIRPGVTFHSGKPLEAADIIASIDLHRGKDSTSPAKSYVEPITGITSEGDKKIVFKLAGPNVDFPNILADFRLVIVPAKDGKADRQSHDGTGAYVLKSFEPGQRMLFERNENYWNVDNGGFFDSAEVVIIADAVARMNALRSGQVDIINQPDLKTLELLKRVGNINVEDVSSGRYYIFGMMSDVDPFTDRNIRQALKYAVKREEMVKKILFGHGSLGNDQPIDAQHKYFNASIPQREYDPERVKFHLKQAGLSSLTIPLSVAEAAFPGAIAASALYSASCAEAGITLDVTREADDGYFDNVWLKKPFTGDYWTKQPSADAQFSQAFSMESPWNETHFKNDRFSELLVKARATIDEAQRTAMYHEMQQLIHEESGAVIPMFANYVWASNKKIKHQAVLATKGDLDGFRCIERWWFEE